MLEYSDYLVLSDKGQKLSGDYTGYNNFKEALKVVETIASKQVDSYLYNDKFHQSPITVTEANTILESCRTGNYKSAVNKVKNIANQIGIRKI